MMLKQNFVKKNRNKAFKKRKRIRRRRDVVMRRVSYEAFKKFVEERSGKHQQQKEKGKAKEKKEQQE